MKTIFHFLITFLSLIIISELAIRFTHWGKVGDLIVIIIYSGIAALVVTWTAMSAESKNDK